MTMLAYRKSWLIFRTAQFCIFLHIYYVVSKFQSFCWRRLRRMHADVTLRYVTLCSQVLTETSSKAEVLSCAFYNVLHDRHFNVVYNFRFPLSAARCRLVEWRRWQHSPSQRGHCRKWFMGTSRGYHGGRVTVVRGRESSEGTMTVVDSGSLANLRRISKSMFNRRVFPTINLEAVDSSAFQVHSAGVAVADE